MKGTKEQINPEGLNTVMLIAENQRLLNEIKELQSTNENLKQKNSNLTQQLVTFANAFKILSIRFFLIATELDKQEQIQSDLNGEMLEGKIKEVMKSHEQKEIEWKLQESIRRSDKIEKENAQLIARLSALQSQMKQGNSTALLFEKEQENEDLKRQLKLLKGFVSDMRPSLKKIQETEEDRSSLIPSYAIPPKGLSNSKENEGNCF